MALYRISFLGEYMKKTLTLLTLCLLLGACGFSARNKASKYTENFTSGKYLNACQNVVDKELCVTEIPEDKLPEVGKTGLDNGLNAATALFVDKKFNTASQIFEDKSHKIIEKQRQSVATNIGKAATEIIANASLLGYTPYVMDGIYLSTYQILNMLALQDNQGLRLEVNRAYQKQQMAAELLENQIRKQQEENQANQEAAAQTEKILGEYADLAKWKGYEDFLNPYATYLSGLAFLTHAESSSDYETAATYLKRVLGMIPENTIIREDVEAAEAAANGIQQPQNATWIIFENGLVANLEEFRIDLPIFLVSKEVQTASLAIPRPKERASAYNFIQINAGESASNTQLLADVDSMFISEFNKRFPGILTKAIIKLTAQTIAQAAAKKNLGTWGSIGAAVYSVATAGADLRSWYSLPKNVQLGKVKKTGTAQMISFKTDGGLDLGSVEVPATGNHLIYIRVPAAGTTPSISLFQL